MSHKHLVLFAGVYYGTNGLATHLADESHASAFNSIVPLVLGRIDPNDSKSVTLTYEQFMIHYTSVAGTDKLPLGMVYIAITGDDTNRRIPFMFLMKLKEEFNSMFLSAPDNDEIIHSIVSALPNSFNSKFGGVLRRLMSEADSGMNDPTYLAKDEIQEVQKIMVQNIERVLERGEQIGLLVNKTDTMGRSATTFKRRAVSIRRIFWWQNVRMWVLIILGLALLTYFLSALECGFPFFQKCLRSDMSEGGSE